MPAWALKAAAGGTADWFLQRLAVARVIRPEVGFDTIIGDDFGGSILSELTDVVGTADATPSSNDSAGVVTLSVGDNVEALSTGRLALTGAGSHVKVLSSTPWYMAALVKITQPLDVTQLGDTRVDAVNLWGDSANWVAIGILGNASGGSVTNWVGSVDNGGTITTTLGPALDGEESPVWHLFEAWIDADGDLHFAIDDQEFNSTIDAANVPSVSAMLSVFGQRSAVGDPALVNVDKYVAIVKSPTVGEP